MSLLVIVVGPLSQSLKASLEKALKSQFSLLEVAFVDASERAEWVEWSSDSTFGGLGVGKGAAGCWLAHLQAWIEGNNSDFENIMILEDDAKISKFGKRNLSRIVEVFRKSDISMLHLGDHERSIFLRPVSLILSGNLRMILKHFIERIVLYPLSPRISLTRFPYSAHGYLVKKWFLPALIKNAPMFITPVDVYLNSVSQVPNNRVGSVRTPLIVQAHVRGSLIDEFGR